MKEGNYITNYNPEDLIIKEKSKTLSKRELISNELLKGRKLHDLIIEYPTIIYEYARLK